MNVDVLAKLISTVAAQRLFFDAITALVAGMLGLIALRLGSRALREERWIQYFGGGFLIFAVQYAVPSLVGLNALFGRPVPDSLSLGVEWFQRLLSGANNVVFLAAGLALWKPGWRPRLRYWILASAIALLSVLMDWAGWFAPWHRSLDGIFSALAVGSLGVAFYVNASPRRRWWLGVFATSGALLYALLSLAFATVPAFAAGKVEPGLARQISDALGAPPGSIHPQLGPDLDSFLIAIALFLKALLALGGFALILRALVPISPRELGKILDGVSRGDLDYFSGDGIVQVVGRSLSADGARICFRLPGMGGREVTQWAWPNRADLAPVVPLPPPDDGREGEVLATGRTLSNPAWESSRAGGWRWWRRWWQARSLIATPVLFQGTVIGCLTVEWDRPRGFTNTAVPLAERLAEMLGPVIESRRRLEALVFWSRRLQELKLETSPPGYKNLASILASLVHETLSPLAVSLALKVGFAPVWAAAGDGGAHAGFPDDLPFGGLEQVLRELGTEDSTRIEMVDIKFGTTPIGSLTVLWPEIKPPLIRPLIRSDVLHLQSITPLIANIVLRLAEADFSRMLSDLQVDLTTVQRLEEWSAAVVKTVLWAGPIWVLTELEDGELHGNGLPELVKEHSAQAEGKSLIWHTRLQQPQAGTHHLVRVLLQKSQAKLWLGVSNPELEPELESAWPWRSFLERLAEAADASLSGLSTSAELHKVRKEAGQIQGLLQSTVDSGAFIHEMRNIARNFKFAAQALDLARHRGKLTASIDIEADILSMQRSAERLYGLADAVLKPSALDGRLVYPLDELVHEVHSLFEPILRQHRIIFLEAVPPNLEIATPSYAVHLALVSLVSNSIDAIQSDGTIRIAGEPPRNGTVACQVIDSGPGIQLPDPESVFELGTSTKEGTGGKGLFMIRQLLSSVGAEIHLTDPAPRQTTFTLNLRPRL